jgi:flagellar basal body-associated protein FliL
MSRLSHRRGILAGGLAGLASVVAGRGALANEEHAPGPPKPSFLVLGEFTVNLHGKSDRFGFIVLSITLDVTPESMNHLKDITPRLKEAVIRRLMVLADRGTLAPGETDPMILKMSLMDTLRKVETDGIKDVLITRLLYG